METYAIMIGFVLNNLFWMIFVQTLKDGKDFITEIKELAPKMPSLRKKRELHNVGDASAKEAAEILKKLVETK